MKHYAKIFFALFLALIVSSTTYAQQNGFVCGATSGLGYLNCYRVDAVYDSWIVRRGQTLYVTIPESDVVPQSRGTMFLFVSGACLGYSSSRPQRSGYFVQVGNQAQWSYTVWSGAVADPCVISLGVALNKCIGANCDPLPQWLDNPARRVNLGVDIGSAVVNLFSLGIFQWFIALFVGGLVGSILFKRIIQVVTQNTDTTIEEYQKKKMQQNVQETEEELGEWKEEKTL